MEDIKHMIISHRRYVKKEAQNNCELRAELIISICPFIQKDCTPCIKLFPIMIEFMRRRENGSLIRTEHPETDTPNCPCEVLGAEVVCKTVAILMED